MPLEAADSRWHYFSSWSQFGSWAVGPRSQPLLPWKTEPNQPWRHVPNGHAMNLNADVTVVRENIKDSVALIPSPHRCSEPTVQICPIQKRSRGFRSGGTPTGGSQRPAEVIQPEKTVQLKGSTESPKVITYGTGSASSWRVITRFGPTP